MTATKTLQFSQTLEKMSEANSALYNMIHAGDFSQESLVAAANKIDSLISQYLVARANFFAPNHMQVKALHTV